MFGQIFWKDRVTEFKDRYRETENPDGTFTHTRVEGEIIQEGTPQNQTNMNALGFGIQDAHIAQAVWLFFALQNQRLEEADPDLYDSLCAGRLTAFGLLQTRMTNADALNAISETLNDKASGADMAELASAVERNAQTASLAAENNGVAAAIVAFGNMQRQRINDDAFSLIASEALGESHTVTLTNTQKFPFNSTVDNPVTVALDTRRKNLFYSVEPEIIANAGPVGEIRVTGKQLNGFKVGFDGCGTSVTLILRVKGGMSHA